MIDQSVVVLKTAKQLDKKTAFEWYNAVLKHINAMNTAQASISGDTRDSRFTKKSVDDGIEYRVYLQVEPTQQQLENLYQEWLSTHNMNFTIFCEGEQSTIPPQRFKTTIDRKHLQDMFSKYLHQSWYHEKSNEGWRYGTEFDTKQKTHPLLLPWEQLPPKFKDIDPNLSDYFLKVVDDAGFDLVRKKDPQ